MNRTSRRPAWGKLVRCLLLAGVVGTSGMASEVPLTLEADHWMPYNGDGERETGYVLDLVRAIFEPKGIPVVFSPTPWARALQDARTGKCLAVIGALKQDAPDFVFPEEETGRACFEFYVKAGSDWKYQGIGSLEGRFLGVAKDYRYFPELDDYISGHPQEVCVSFGTYALERNVRLLLLGRLDAVVDDANVLRFFVARQQLSGQLVSAGAGGQVMKNYLAFSPAHPKSRDYARILSQGLRALRKSGQLRKILAKYGLSDWK